MFLAVIQSLAASISLPFKGISSGAFNLEAPRLFLKSVLPLFYSYYFAKRIFSHLFYFPFIATRTAIVSFLPRYFA